MSGSTSLTSIPTKTACLNVPVATGSRFIVTGDGDLRVLKVADFLELIRETPA